MNSKILITGCVVLLAIGCRRKSADDYEYYKPSTQKPSIVAVDSSAIKETQAEALVLPEVKGVDLSDNYFIVVASYTVESYAKSQKADIEEQGYKPAVFMMDEDGWYKLAVESYATRSEANEALTKLHDKGGIFSEARIVFKKNK